MTVTTNNFTGIHSYGNRPQDVIFGENMTKENRPRCPSALSSYYMQQDQFSERKDDHKRKEQLKPYGRNEVITVCVCLIVEKRTPRWHKPD